MHRVKWSTVRLTKWPSTIAIRFVITLHSLPVGWFQGQGAHIMTVSWFRVIMTRFWHEVTIITTSCYLPRFSYNTIAFYGPHRSCYKGFLLYMSWNTYTIIIPLALTKLKGGYTGFTSSVRLSVHRYVRLSVCGQNGVRSVSYTILTGSISYVHMLSSNFRRCVVCKGYGKIKKIEFLANFLNL